MIVLDLIGIVVFIALVVSYLRSEEDFAYWLFDDFFTYLLKGLAMVGLIILMINRIDWNFLFFEIF